MTATKLVDPGTLFRDLLDLLSIQVDTLIEQYPETNVEARRTITRDLHFEPRAEELQAITRIASDDGATGPRHDLPRSLLCVRILADREQKRVIEAPSFDAAAMRRSAALLDELLVELRRVTLRLEDITAIDSTVSLSDREFLLKIGNAFSFPQQQLRGCRVLAMRLAELSEFHLDGRLVETTANLSSSDRESIVELLGRGAPDASSRVHLDALAMQSHAANLLQAWQALGPPSEDDESTRLKRDGCLQALTNAQLALDEVAVRVQTQQDGAVVANLHTLVDELRSSGRLLFSTKLALAPILRAPYDDTHAIADTPGSESLRDLLCASIATDLALDEVPKQASEEEIYVGALRDMRHRKEQLDLDYEKQQRPSVKSRQRRRMAAMLITAGLLAVVSGVVNFVLLPPTANAATPPQAHELSPALKTKRVRAAGPILFTHTEGWNRLDNSTQQAKIEALGGIVSGGAFSTVVVFDEYGQPAAAWQQGAGSGLIKAPQ